MFLYLVVDDVVVVNRVVLRDEEVVKDVDEVVCVCVCEDDDENNDTWNLPW